jgi:nicotinamidase-related amidase
MRPTLILLDCQCERGGEADPSQQRVIERITRLLSTARHRGWTVMHSQFQAPASLNPIRLLPAAPIPALKPLAREPVFVRSALSAYSDRDFAPLVQRQLASPVFLVGFSAPFSVLATVFDSVARGQRLTVIPEAVGTSPLGAQTTSNVTEVALELIGRLTRTMPWDAVKRDWIQAEASIAKKQMGLG